MHDDDFVEDEGDEEYDEEHHVSEVVEESSH